jgi:hypothetical protein
MRHFGAFVRFLAVLLGAGRVLLRLDVLAALMMMGRLAVMVGGRLVFAGRLMMMLARFVLGFHGHREFLLKNAVRGVAGQSARLIPATNFPFLGPREVEILAAPQAKKKPTWRNALGHSTTSAYSLTSPPANRVAL